MESNVKDALVELFPVGCDLLDTGLALKVPQPGKWLEDRVLLKWDRDQQSSRSKAPDAAIVTSGYEVEAMLVHCQAGNTVQVRHHAAKWSIMEPLERFNLESIVRLPVYKCPCVVVIESDVSIFVTSYR